MKYRSLYILFAVILTATTSRAADPQAGLSELDQTAIDAYIYTYPLVVMDVTRRNMRMPVSLAGIGPVNQFNHARAFPRAAFKAVVRPNFDTLYSSAWVDLTKEPIVLTIPDTGGRYFIMQMLDMWTEVFAAPGKRTIGTQGAKFLIAPSKWTGSVPDGLQRIDAPTPFIWIIGRTYASSENEFPAVHEIQNGYLLTPLSQLDAPPDEVEPEAGKADQNTQVEPTGKPEDMSAKDYFAYAAQLLQLHPPHPEDDAMLSRIKALGIAPRMTFDFDKLDDEVQNALEQAPARAQALIKEKEPNVSEMANGWRLNIKTMGSYGTDYLKRAIVAKTALGANLPEDAVYPMAFVDENGDPLDGKQKYVMHFERDQLPPVEAFWSVTLYKEDGFPSDNKLNRYALGSEAPMSFNSDGSLDIYIQNESPGEDKEANWLPVPEREFNLTMRLYSPKKEVLDGTWAPPPVQKASQK